MIGQQQTEKLAHATVYDRAGEKVGNVRQVFVDDASGAPGWVSVHTGLFGTKESFVPVHDARLDNDRLTVGVDKQQVKDAPQIDPETDQSGREHIDDNQVAELYRYYNLPYASGRDHDDVQGRRGEPAGGRRREAGAERARQGSGGEQPAEMTRYEEQLRVGKEPVTSGRVRLRKYVTTEDVTTTVPVRREEVRVEREPVSGAQGEPRHEFAEETAETTLHAERPVVQTEAVPVEKVRLDKQTQSREETVGGKVRKEHVEVEDETRGRGRHEGGTPQSRR